MVNVYQFPPSRLVGSLEQEEFLPALRAASAIVETIAYGLAGKVSTIFVSELILLSAELDRASERLVGQISE